MFDYNVDDWWSVKRQIDINDVLVFHPMTSWQYFLLCWHLGDNFHRLAFLFSSDSINHYQCEKEIVFVFLCCFVLLVFLDRLLMENDWNQSIWQYDIEQEMEWRFFSYTYWSSWHDDVWFGYCHHHWKYNCDLCTSNRSTFTNGNIDVCLKAHDTLELMAKHRAPIF